MEALISRVKEFVTKATGRGALHWLHFNPFSGGGTYSNRENMVLLGGEVLWGKMRVVGVVAARLQGEARNALSGGHPLP